MIKRTIHIILGVVAIFLIAASLSFVHKKHSQSVCREVLVTVSDSLENQFITSNEIEEWISRKMSNVMGQRLDSIDTRGIEDILEKLEPVHKATVYTSLRNTTGVDGGTLVVDIEQRKPVFRVFYPGVDYYIDTEGQVMAWSSKFTARVLLISGNVTKESAKNVLFPMVSFIHGDRFWNSLIDQIIVNSNQELTLIPRVGDYRILFGKADNYHTKFRNLKALYEDGFRYAGWKKYKTINLKYQNQIVCTKK